MKEKELNIKQVILSNCINTDEIIKMYLKYPNDAELGKEVRKYVNTLKKYTKKHNLTF